MSISEPLNGDMPLSPTSGPEDASGVPSTGDKASADKKRGLLVRALSDLVVHADGHLSGHERGLLDTILTRILPRLSVEQRRHLSERLANTTEGPAQLMAALAVDQAEIAAPLLERGLGLQNSDLVQIIQETDPPHWAHIAARRALSTAVSDILISHALKQDATGVLIRVLSNDAVSLSRNAMALLVHRAATLADIQGPLLARAEMTFSLAHTLFWSAPAGLRVQILTRYSVERRTLQEIVGTDILDDALTAVSADPVLSGAFNLLKPAERVPDAEITRLLNFLEGQQTGEFIDAVSVAAHIRPETVLKLVGDAGGEPIAVLGKAIGLRRADLSAYLQGATAIRSGTALGADEFDGIADLFDSLSRDRADLILHYWDQVIADSLNASSPEDAKPLTPTGA